MKAVLLDPRSSPGTPGSTSVFVIDNEGGGILRAQDLWLHFAVTVTQSIATDITRFQQDVGSAGAVRELRVYDSMGRRIYQVREASHFANWRLMSTRTSAAQRDIDARTLLNRRALQVLPSGDFRRSADGPLLTASTATTAHAMVPLGLLCPLFAAGLIPMRKTGSLRLEVDWQTQAGRFLQITDGDGTPAAGSVTNFAINSVQLSYSCFVNQQAAAIYAGLNDEQMVEFIEPRLATQTIDLNPADYSLSLGGAGERVSGLLIAAVDDNSTAYTHAFSMGADSLINLRVNGRKQFPVDLTYGQVLSETEKYAGGLAVCTGGWTTLAGHELGLGPGAEGVASRNLYSALPLKPAANLPASMANATEADVSGLVLEVKRVSLATHAQVVYGYAMCQKAIPV